MYGKHHTKEVVERIRKLNKINFSGEKNLNYSPSLYKLKNEITGEIFEGTQYNFKKKYNLKSAPVCNLLNGKRRCHHNWILFFDK